MPDESLLKDLRGELPEFPRDVFPLPLSNWLLRATRGAGVRIDHIAVLMLGVASSLIGKARRVQASSSGIEPTTLWACIVGQSGDRKPPGLRVILRVLDRIEEENSPQFGSFRYRVPRAANSKSTGSGSIALSTAWMGANGNGS